MCLQVGSGQGSCFYNPFDLCAVELEHLYVGMGGVVSLTTWKKPKDGEGVSLETVDANPALKYSDLPSQGRQKRESRVRGGHRVNSVQTEENKQTFNSFKHTHHFLPDPS